jgi:cob(I)alamin adenosyltransferase
VNTGDGKGKSTAAFGVVMRALARGWRVCVIQFIKSGEWKVGEKKIASQLGVDWLEGGDGFSWESTDLDESASHAAAAWQAAATAITSGEYQLVVLDEVTYPMTWGWIETARVIDTIVTRPSQVNIIATGRNAPEELMDVADTVTKMVKVRHAFDQGIAAKRGIDF